MGQTCRACGKQSHFERVCRSKGEEKQGAMRCSEDGEAAMDTLIVHIVFYPAILTYKPSKSSLEEFEVTLIPFSLCPDPRQIRDIPVAHPTRLKTYPDNGATIRLGGLTHLQDMALSERNLVPSKKQKKGMHRQRIFLSKSRLVTCHVRNRESNHKAGFVYIYIYVTKYK